MATDPAATVKPVINCYRRSGFDGLIHLLSSRADRRTAVSHLFTNRIYDRLSNRVTYDGHFGPTETTIIPAGDLSIILKARKDSLEVAPHNELDNQPTFHYVTVNFDP